MADVRSKSEYADYAGVRPAAVSNWIARKKLTAPALRRDGKIDVALADRQLGMRLDPMKSASASSREQANGGDTDMPGWSAKDQANQQLLRARAVDASVHAERNRRKLQEERGKYMLAAQAEAEWATALTGFLQDVEASFTDLNYQLDGLDERQRLLAIRRWWREQRARAAAANRLAAETADEFIPDTAA